MTKTEKSCRWARYKHGLAFGPERINFDTVALLSTARATFVNLLHFGHRHTPMRLPRAADIRHRIAIFATAFSATQESFEDLLGPVEIASKISPGVATWRLASYLGTYEQNIAIERAVGEAQRSNPLMGI